MRQLEEAGYSVTHDTENPEGEIAVINTCGFIGDAKEESINMILEFAERKEEGDLKKLFVMGCLSERYLQELAIEIPQVDKFYGKFNWKELLHDLGKTYHEELYIERTLTTPKHYAYLKISEGCDRKCSYCAIPIITGHHISKPIEEILDEVRYLVSQGVKEFQVIAQELTYYGIDLYKKQMLPELIERISEIPGVEWIRLHYAYPAHFPTDLFRVMRERDNVCKYMDIALQHISDNMLKLMRRQVSKEDTYKLIEQFRKEVPGIHLRTTLMVGHPGETEEDFEELKEFVRKARFDRMGALPSPISLASLWVPPAPGKSPNPVSGSANNASSDTTRKSQAIAVSQPPPNAYPFTAAITGLEHFWIRSSAFCPAPPKQSVDFFVFRLLRSAPAINAFSPAPVTIITFTSSALSAHVKNWFISAHDRSFKAFIFSGRLAVNTAIPCSSISSLKFWYSIKYETSLHICCYNINYFSVLFHLHIFQK